MSDKDEIEISAGDKGLSLKAKGGAASRLGHALADLISPFSNLAGLGGDKIRNLRIYQELAFQKTLETAHRIATENNIEVKPVSTKMIVAWSEGASMEDVESENSLSDLWASLLVSEVEQSEPNTLIYIDILRKLNGTHVQFLHQLLGKKFPYAVGNPSITFDVGHVAYSLKEPFEGRTDVAFSGFPETEMKNKIDEINLMPGIELLTVSHVGRTDGSLHSGFTFEWIREEDADCEGEQPDLIFSSLAALNLVERHSGEVEILSGIYLNYIASTLTPLGWDFLRACSKDL